MGAGTVFITYLVAREVFPKRPSIAIGAMAFVAFNPKFIFISGAVHNDNLATFLSSLAILCSLRLVRMGESALRGFLLGTILGLSLLAKLSSLPLLPVIGVAALLTAIRQRSKMAFVRSALAIFIIAAIISGWWFVRNIFVYGEPTGIKVTLKVWQGERPPDYKLYLSLLELPHAWISFWGKFGMGQIPIPSAIHSALGWIAGAAGVGFSIFIYQQLKWKVFGAVNFMQLLILLAHLLFSLAALVGYISLTVAGSMGRFLFPAFSAIGTLFFFGLSRLIPKNLIGILAAAVNLGLASLSVICLLFYLIPAYVKPPLLSQEEIEAIPNPLDVEFGGVMKLLGYEIEKEQVRPGEKLSITLYWESLAKMERNWSVFVHLLDEEGIIVAQRDTYPGLGRYPTTIWAVGDSIADRYAIAIPETAFSPTRASIEVGLYYLPTGERLLASSEEGKVLGDSVQLGWIEIVPREGDFPNPLRLEFDGRIALLGYELERRSAYPGESVRLTLYWQALSKMKENYTVFVHLLREGDQIWAGVDKELSPPTSTWEKGEVIVEEYELVISPDAPADVYEMEIGLYPPDMSRRLRVKWDGTWADRVFLSKIRVVERLPRSAHPILPVIYCSVISSFGLVNITPVLSNSTSSPSQRSPVQSDTLAACCMLWVTITMV
jgi:hypothetical protein